MQKLVEKYFNISHDASASLIITLLTFFLGYLITGSVFLISRYFNRRANRKIFISNLISLSRPLKAQEASFSNLLESMDFTTNSLWSYDKVDFFQLLTFRELGYKDSFNSFFHGFENQFPSCIKKSLKRKAFNRTWSIISNIEFWAEKALMDFSLLLEKYNAYGDSRNKAMNELRIMWENLLSVNPATIPENHFNYLNELSIIIAQFAQTPTLKRVGPYFAHRNLILKIRILNKKYKTLPFIREVNDKCLAVSGHYIDMEMLLRNTKHQYKVYYYSFREFNKTINKIAKILR